MKNFKYVFELFKIRQTLAAVFLGIIIYVKCSNFNVNFYSLFLLFVALFLTLCGSTGINMVLDSDIDKIMKRTKNRPIPSGKIDGRSAFLISFILTFFGLTISFFLNFYVFLFGLLGVLIFDVLYTFLLKRKTPLNVIICSTASMMPILAGASLTQNFTLEILLLSFFVCVWSLSHIWSTAIYWVNDYKRAKVPMLPVIYGIKKTYLILFFIFLFFYLPIIFFLFSNIIILLTLLTFIFFLSFFSFKGFLERKRKLSFYIFKINSIYLLALFLSYLFAPAGI